MARAVDLYKDWCLSHDYPLDQPTEQRLSLWAAECPSAASTTLHRQLSVGRVLGLPAGAQRPVRAHTASVFDGRRSKDWFSVPEAFRALPGGLHGRRDGFLLAVLDGGASVNAVRRIAESSISLLPRPVVAGTEPPVTDEPAFCGRCAVTRWLRVVGPAARGAKSEVREILAVDSHRAVHDCWIGLDGSWRGAPQLIPAIDRHGWLAGEPLSRRAVFSILNQRLRRVDVPDNRLVPGRSVLTADNQFAQSSLQDLADAYDTVDDDLDALLARTAWLLGDGEALAGRLTELGVC